MTITFPANSLIPASDSRLCGHAEDQKPAVIASGFGVIMHSVLDKVKIDKLRVMAQFDAVAAIPQGGIAKWRRKAASTSN